jgi:hypothetical protein
MTTQQWQPGTLYNPGAIVRRVSAPPIVAVPPTNPGFEDGDTGWTKGTGWGIVSNNDNPFSGTWTAEKSGVGTALLLNDNIVEVVPGQSITASCQVEQGASGVGGTRTRVILQWLDQSQTLISTSQGNEVIDGRGGAWHPSTVTAVAPANARYVRIGASGNVVSGPSLWVDAFQWNYAFQPAIDGIVFRAVQPDAGFSGATEPLWPDTVGQQVVDNEVIWEAINSSTVTWEANPILVSGYDEPNFVAALGATASDNDSIIWTAISRRVEDERCPNTPIVAIAASKIFCGDDDIIAFSATVNPLDWSTPDDAGYLPFGLQTHGANPVAALGLYRSNLVAFNASGFQMWQVDQDPLNMALLDAAPIGSEYTRSIQPVQNDLAFLGGVGIRNIGIAGASTNLQAGTFGENIDALVIAKLREAEVDPISCVLPSYGQYWLIFGEEAFVLTVNDTRTLRWSRYVFPEAIVHTTLVNGDLYLRTDQNKVWKLTDLIEGLDDVYCQPTAPVLSGEIEVYGLEITGLLTWTAADFGYIDIDSYILQRAIGAAGAFTDLVTVDGDTLAYNDTDMEFNVVHRYRVIAVPASDGIPSLPSNIVSLSAAGLSPPPVLSGEIQYTDDGYLTWVQDPPTIPIHEYDLYRSVNGGLYEYLATTPGDVFEYVDEDLSATSVYLYYVVARSYDGELSLESNVVELSYGGFGPITWINPGAELGDLTGWTVTLGGPGVVARPWTGSLAFWGGTSPVTKMYQDFDIPLDSWTDEVANGNVRVVVDWQGGTWAQGGICSGDQASIVVYALDDEGATLASQATGPPPCPFPSGTNTIGSQYYYPYVTTLNLPVGTTSVRVELIGTRNHGTNNDASFDDVLPHLELIS